MNPTPAYQLDFQIVQYYQQRSYITQRIGIFRYRIGMQDHFFYSLRTMYLLNCQLLISLFPNPATLFITSWISSSLKLYFNCSEILFKSQNSSFPFCQGSTKSNIACLPVSEKGFPTLLVINVKKFQKLTHSPANYLDTEARASKMILYFLSNPRVLAVLSMSETSHCLWLSQQRLNISKKSSQCSLEKTGFLATISRANTTFLSFYASSLRLCSMLELTIIMISRIYIINRKTQFIINFISLSRTRTRSATGSPARTTRYSFQIKIKVHEVQVPVGQSLLIGEVSSLEQSKSSNKYRMSYYSTQSQFWTQAYSI